MTEYELLFPKPLREIPLGWEIVDQKEAIAAGNIVRAWDCERRYTFQRYDMSTNGKPSISRRVVYILPIDR